MISNYVKIYAKLTGAEERIYFTMAGYSEEVVAVSVLLIAPVSSSGQWLFPFPGGTMYEQRSLLQFASMFFLSCCFTRLSDHWATRPSYRHRVHLDPDTGSLWLRDFQSNDSGVYVISVYRDGVSTATEGNVTLTVYNETDVESTTQPGSTTSQSRGSTESIKYLYIIVPVVGCFLIVLILFILVTKKYKGSCLQHDSVAMETHDQPIEGMRQAFAEGQDSVLNSDLTYSLLQWPEHRIPAASGGGPQDSGLETIYAFPQKVNRK
ncbi:hypothetical protein chiPu_0017077 [Chiloscyllium punctatum]|uniref:Immunoglobulin subtype domain-containing protein n=1 Tax=Chiloscyllium punctatum TaxID=137246 RepID=A0A401T7G5_CHIPU|nr:hypothetical protein [Chiloscyllium punctatum]